MFDSQFNLSYRHLQRILELFNLVVHLSVKPNLKHNSSLTPHEHFFKLFVADSHKVYTQLGKATTK